MYFNSNLVNIGLFIYRYIYIYFELFRWGIFGCRIGDNLYNWEEILVKRQWHIHFVPHCVRLMVSLYDD